MDAEFEERQFEAHLNWELSGQHGLVYVPGQVFEKRLAVDAALFSSHPIMIKLFSPTYPPRAPFLPGILLEQAWWRALEKEENTFPKFRCNVFLQHKRPEYLQRSNSSQWSLWHKPYYRFRVVHNQHMILRKLEQRIGSAGVVLYSCPAFHTLRALWQCISTEALIKNTNFSQPDLIGDHTAFTFTEPGRTGIANPEPNKVVSYNLLERLEKLTLPSREPLSNLVFLERTAALIEEIVSEIDSLRSTYHDVVSHLTESARFPSQRAAIRIYAFCFLYGLSWSIGIARSQKE